MQSSFSKFLSKQLFDKKIIKVRDNNYPRISIVMPSYNQGEFIERSILSILNQNYPNLELIIIDGGSTDNTLEVIKKYEEYLYYFVSERDNGQSHALNKGFAVATGDIFTWQNSDDIYLPNILNIVSEIFKDNQDIKICYGDWYSIDTKDEITEKTYAMVSKKPNSPYEVMNIYMQAMFWKKGVHKKINEHLHRGMDYDLILYFLLNYAKDEFFKVDKFLAAFRRHPEQKTKTDETAIWEEDFLVKKYNFSEKNSVKGIF